MNSDQTLIAVLTMQRNQALDALAQTAVQSEMLQSKINDLESLVKHLQEVSVPKEKDE